MLKKLCIAALLLGLPLGLHGCSSDEGSTVGEGVRAQERLALCLDLCNLQDSCELFTDPECSEVCEREEQQCKADRMNDECFDALISYEECRRELSCSETEQLSFGSGTKPCSAEFARYIDNGECPSYNSSSRSTACNKDDPF